MSSKIDNNLSGPESLVDRLSTSGRYVVLFSAFAGLVFAGAGLGLMPIASRSITLSFLDSVYTEQAAGVWLAYFTASLMFGAACGGVWLGQLGDRIGRTRAMGLSIIFYSLFAGAGALVENQTQLAILRFLAGLGIGGMWPNGAALVAECFPRASRPFVAGVVGAGINVGIFLLAQIAQNWHITAESWRWIFAWSAVPALMGLAAMWLVPESPKWKASRNQLTAGIRAGPSPLSEVFREPFLRVTLAGIALGTIPLVGAWAASKWTMPWADQIGKQHDLGGYQATTQSYWAMGAILGSFFGAPISSLLGRWRSYFLISLASAAATCGLFLFTQPMTGSFLPWAATQGFVTTLFFGWLPLFLPEMFPTRLRATGTGVAYNSGRFLTAGGVLIAGRLIEAFHGDYPKVGAVTGLVYILGMFVVWWASRAAAAPIKD
jgi:MFS family permease